MSKHPFQIMYSNHKLKVFPVLIAIIIIGIFFSCKEQKEALSEPLQNTQVEVKQAQNQIIFDSSLYEFEADLIKLNWKHLMSIQFEKRFSEDLGIEVDLPVFNDTIQALDGKNVLAEGYYIPVDETGDESILIISAFPFAECFFCGAAGAESVIDVLNIGKLPRLKTDQKVKFKGRLKLNKDNFDFLIYVLEQAELVKS